MGIKYVKDFEFPAAAGFRDSAMPSKAGMSSKGMPSRAKPNAPARGAARMESKPKMGKGQGYAAGGKVPGREMDRLPAKKPPGRTMDLAPSKSFKGEYQGYAKGGQVQKFSNGSKGPVRGRGAAPAPGSLASLARNPNPNVAANAWAKGQKTMFPIYQRTGFPAGRSGTESNYQYDPAYDPAFEQGYREFEQSERGLAKGGKVAKVMREYKAGKLHSGSKKGPTVKNPKQAMAIALSEARKSGEKVVKKSSGGPTTRVPTGPTAPRYGYLPNPFGRDIRYKLGPSGGAQPRMGTKNPSDFFGNENPNYNRALAEYEEELRQQQPKERARGGTVLRQPASRDPKPAKPAARANGGMMSKGPATRGTPAKGRAQGRMDFAEKYAPGLSIDMPGKRVKKK